MNIAKEHLKRYYSDSFIKILLGIKLFSTIIGFTGLIKNFLFFGSTIWSLFFILAWTYSIEMTKMEAILIIIGWSLFALMWVVFYFIFCFAKKKRRIPIAFFIIANVFDGFCALGSMLQFFTLSSMFGLIFSFFIVLILIVLLREQSRCVS